MRTQKLNSSVASRLWATFALAAVALCSCASEPVGYSKTTTKTTTDNPTEKTTVTETREKNTTISPN